MSLPRKLDAAIARASQVLVKKLQCTTADAPSHKIVAVTGWSKDATTIEAIGTYLVGLYASAIATTLAVRASITDTDEDRLELVENITALSRREKHDERNPWIAEGLWHLCLYISSKMAGIHPHGKVIALDQPHIGAKDHGFDVVALFETDKHEIGVSIVECKAYANDPNGAIGSAVEFFRAFDAGQHNARIRQTVAQMRDLLPDATRKLVSVSLWKSRRLYIPNPHYDDKHLMNWTNARPSFESLDSPVLVMPHPIPQFDSFFEKVMDAMLKFAKGL